MPGTRGLPWYYPCHDIATGNALLPLLFSLMACMSERWRVIQTVVAGASLPQTIGGALFACQPAVGDQPMVTTA